jgi:hypothetical protein
VTTTNGVGPVLVTRNPPEHVVLILSDGPMMRHHIGTPALPQPGVVDPQVQPLRSVHHVAHATARYQTRDTHGGDGHDGPDPATAPGHRDGVGAG